MPGEESKRAAIFQEELCGTILRGFRAQLLLDRRMRPGEAGVVEAEGVECDGDDEIRRFHEQEAKSSPTILPGEEVLHAGAGSQAKRPSDPKWHAQDAWALKFHIRSDRFVDDLTGLPLNEELCRRARQKEIDYFQSKGVWEIRPVNEARASMGRPPISVRWVETNKGDDQNPNIHSRLVAREIRTAG